MTARPALAVVLRYGLAVASGATSLVTTLILRHYGFPPRFISHFTLIAIAITFWCAGTGPGLLALLLSSLGVSLLARNHLLLPGFPLESFLIFYAVFSILMSWFSASRRRAEQLLIDGSTLCNRVRVQWRTFNRAPTPAPIQDASPTQFVQIRDKPLTTAAGMPPRIGSVEAPPDRTNGGHTRFQFSALLA